MNQERIPNTLDSGYFYSKNTNLEKKFFVSDCEWVNLEVFNLDINSVNRNSGRMNSFY